MQPPRGFQWDAAKAEQNVIKHGVAFAEAATVFDGPAVWVRDDDAHSWDEDRLLATGRSIAGRLLTVSYTMRADDTRIISAWSATGEEHRNYYEHAEQRHN